MRHKISLPENPTFKDIENHLTGSVQKKLWKIIKEQKGFVVDEKSKSKYGETRLWCCLLNFCRKNILKKIDGKIGTYEMHESVQID